LRFNSTASPHLQSAFIKNSLDIEIANPSNPLKVESSVVFIWALMEKLLEEIMVSVDRILSDDVFTIAFQNNFISKVAIM